MADATTRTMTLAEAEAALLAPGAPFELSDELVLGEPMQVFKRRLPSLRAVLEASAARGDAEHMVFHGASGEERRFTYRAQLALVARAAATLRTRFGIGPGERVAILAQTSPEWLVTFWATQALGAVAVALNAWWTAPEIAFALGDCRPKLLVVDAKRAARIQEGGVETGVPTLVVEDELTEMLRGAELGDEVLPVLARPIAEDDPAIIVYTSGTTGRPKGAVHSNRNVLALVGCNSFHGARIAMTTSGPPPAAGSGALPPPTVLVTSPLFHVSGLHSAAVACLANGVRTVWMMGRFDAARALAIIAREKVTSWGYTATLLHRITHHPDVLAFDRASLRQLGGGGSPIAPSLQARAREVFPGVAATFGVGYGLTECTALATLNAGAELTAHPRSVGRPMPTVSVEIRDDDGHALGEGASGEIYVRSPLVMLGYWENDAATDASIGPGRWLRTGDLGRIEGGRLYLETRKRDLILRGGENVYPVEIEQRLELHPSVAEAAVFGVPHSELGEEVKAVVVPREGATLDLGDLTGWAAAALAYFKVPAHWEVRSTPLPRNATGKVLKEVLRGGEANGFEME